MNGFYEEWLVSLVKTLKEENLDSMTLLDNIDIFSENVMLAKIIITTPISTVDAEKSFPS